MEKKKAYAVEEGGGGAGIFFDIPKTGVLAEIGTETITVGGEDEAKNVLADASKDGEQNAFATLSEQMGHAIDGCFVIDFF